MLTTVTSYDIRNVAVITDGAGVRYEVRQTPSYHVSIWRIKPGENPVGTEVLSAKNIPGEKASGAALAFDYATSRLLLIAGIRIPSEGGDNFLQRVVDTGITVTLPPATNAAPAAKVSQQDDAARQQAAAALAAAQSVQQTAASAQRTAESAQRTSSKLEGSVNDIAGKLQALQSKPSGISEDQVATIAWSKARDAVAALVAEALNGSDPAGLRPLIRAVVTEMLKTTPTPAPAGPYNADTTICAASRASAEQCTRYMLQRDHGEYSERDISGVIVPAYFELCRKAGVDPLVAIVQLIHETGNLTSWWAARPRRNPAGIGVTGRQQAEQPAGGAWQRDDAAGVWKEGVAFASWPDDAIVAHIGRLLAYALPEAQRTPTQQELVTRGLTYRALPTELHGSAPTLRRLGGAHNPTGQGWAMPGTEYGERLAALMNAISAC